MTKRDDAMARRVEAAAERLRVEEASRPGGGRFTARLHPRTRTGQWRKTKFGDHELHRDGKHIGTVHVARKGFITGDGKDLRHTEFRATALEKGYTEELPTLAAAKAEVERLHAMPAHHVAPGRIQLKHRPNPWQPEDPDDRMTEEEQLADESQPVDIHVGNKHVGTLHFEEHGTRVKMNHLTGVPSGTTLPKPKGKYHYERGELKRHIAKVVNDAMDIYKYGEDYSAAGPDEEDLAPDPAAEARVAARDVARRHQAAARAGALLDEEYAADPAKYAAASKSEQMKSDFRLRSTINQSQRNARVAGPGARSIHEDPARRELIRRDIAQYGSADDAGHRRAQLIRDQNAVPNFAPASTAEAEKMAGHVSFSQGQGRPEVANLKDMAANDLATYAAALEHEMAQNGIDPDGDTQPNRADGDDGEAAALRRELARVTARQKKMQDHAQAVAHRRQVEGLGWDAGMREAAMNRRVEAARAKLEQEGGKS